MRYLESHVIEEDRYHTATTWGNFMPTKSQWIANAGGLPPNYLAKHRLQVANQDNSLSSPTGNGRVFANESILRRSGNCEGGDNAS